MRHVWIVIAAAALLGASPAPTQWAIRTLRMEGAAVNVREAATELTNTAQRVAASGRMHALAELISDARELNRRVVSARLAAEVLAED